MKRNFTLAAALLLSLVMSMSLLAVPAFATANDLAELETNCEGTTITVDEDEIVNLTKRVRIYSDITLVVNGTIKQSDDAVWNAADTNYGLIQVMPGAELTITGTGTINSQRYVSGNAKGPLSAICAFGSGAKVTINGNITATSDNIALYAYRGGTINVNAGTYTGGTDGKAVYTVGGGKIDLAGGIYSTNPIASGGTLAAGYENVDVGGSYKVVGAVTVAYQATPQGTSGQTSQTAPTTITINGNGASGKSAEVSTSVARDASTTTSSMIQTSTIGNQQKRSAAELVITNAVSTTAGTVTVKEGVAEKELINTDAAKTAIVTAIKKANTAEEISKVTVELQTSLKGYELKEIKEKATGNDTDTKVIATQIIYDVTPVAVVRNDQNETLASETISNEDIARDSLQFEFTLPVPTSLAGEGENVQITHVHGDVSDEPVEETVQNGQVTVTAISFSEFIITPMAYVRSQNDEDAFGIIGTDMRLTGAIEYRFYIAPEMIEIENETLGKYEGGFAKFIIGGNREYIVSLKYAELESATVKEENKETSYKVLSCPVYADELNETVTLVVYKNDSTYPALISYSDDTKDSLNYCMANYWDKVKDPSDKLIALKDAMLAYGDYAQYYDQLVLKHIVNAEIPNRSFSKEAAELTVDGLKQYKSVKAAGKLGIQYVGGALTLNSRLGLKVYFKLDNGASIDDYTFTYDNKELGRATQEGNYYYVRINDLPPNDFENKTITIEKAGNASSESVEYGAYTYIRSVLQTYLTSTDPKKVALVKLVRALYQYGTAATDYARSLQT